VSHVDWAGEWFRILQETGEDTSIAIGRATTPIRWNFLPHEQRDGQASLRFQTQADGVSCASAERDVRRHAGRAPTWVERAALFLGYLRRSHLRHTPWRRRDPRQKARREVPSTLFFSPEETQRLELFARGQGASLNSLCLWALNRAVASFCLPSPERAGWMVPFDMRRVLPESHHQAANLASYVEAEISPRASPGEIHAQIREGLRQRRHWGAWIGTNLGQWISPWVGEARARRILRDSWARHAPPEHSWMGSFSNLGRWESTDSVGYVFCPPCVLTQPIAAGALVWNGRLRLALRLHASLLPGPDEADRLAREWKLILDAV